MAIQGNDWNEDEEDGRRRCCGSAKTRACRASLFLRLSSVGLHNASFSMVLSFTYTIAGTIPYGSTIPYHHMVPYHSRDSKHTVIVSGATKTAPY